jgi:hypothetical protein
MALSARGLNRATLARQLLLRRERLAVEDAVHRVVALQAQSPASPYLALWNRVGGFDTGDLDAAYAEYTVVKASLMAQGGPWWDSRATPLSDAGFVLALAGPVAFGGAARTGLVAGPRHLRPIVYAIVAAWTMWIGSIAVVVDVREGDTSPRGLWLLDGAYALVLIGRRGGWRTRPPVAGSTGAPSARRDEPKAPGGPRHGPHSLAQPARYVARVAIARRSSMSFTHNSTCGWVTASAITRCSWHQANQARRSDV